MTNPFRDVICGGHSGWDRDAIRNDTAPVPVVRIRVPEACSDIANTFIGGIGYVDATEAQARAWLCNPIWRSITEEVAASLLPLIQPTELKEGALHKSEPEPLQTPADIRADERARVADELRKDAARSDPLVAEAAGARSARIVCAVRGEMAESGEIDNVPLDQRVKKPRPTRYRRSWERSYRVSEYGRTYKARVAALPKRLRRGL
jgi:hypothetical protein